jgi:hypothetical protein
VEVKIGVQHAPREIVLESGQTPEEVERVVADALAGKSQLLSLTDQHGRKVLVPADRLAYVELGEPAPRKVGFGALYATLDGRGPAAVRPPPPFRVPSAPLRSPTVPLYRALHRRRTTGPQGRVAFRRSRV